MDAPLRLFFLKSSKGLSEDIEGLCRHCHCVKGDMC